MPINLKALQKRGAEVEVTAYDMTSTVEYDPTRFTPGFRAEYQREVRRLEEERKAKQEAAKDDPSITFDATDQYRNNAKLLCMLVKDWDIIAIDGKKLPIEPDAILDNLPDQLVTHIMVMIWSDVAQLGKSKKTEPSETNASS